MKWKFWQRGPKQPPPCDTVIFEQGEVAAVLVGPRATVIEAFVQSVAQETQQAVDWHYYAGRAVVMTTGDRAKVRDYIETHAIRVIG
jgi:hypothetical protein